ncbi:hypothetical protein L3X38_043946 [Prunus dulcis]|uniref:Uncharacterized protein n=1 Tax=Prunus dulcis TaxID=3755 RepID=A0AAD4YMR0_PRUDU|nr:hypothetical protein L3X38_043946 [Prunus dulcis]
MRTQRSTAQTAGFLTTSQVSVDFHFQSPVKVSNFLLQSKAVETTRFTRCLVLFNATASEVVIWLELLFALSFWGETY